MGRATWSIGITARRVNDTLRTTIRRPAWTFATAQDHAAMARHDVDAMVTAVRRRTGLGSHPELRRTRSRPYASRNGRRFAKATSLIPCAHLPKRVHLSVV